MGHFINKYIIIGTMIVMYKFYEGEEVYILSKNVLHFINYFWRIL